MRTMRTIWRVGFMAVLTLNGCVTAAVRGKVQGSDEVFTGSATGYLNGAGNLTIYMKNGVSCAGEFVYISNRNGTGIFNCTDGKSGPFEFASTGLHGVGSGNVDGKTFTFTFGD